MLPITENNLKQLAKPVPGMEEGKDTKTFEVQSRTVAVHTATDVVITISDFTPLNNGMFEFGSNCFYNGEPVFPLLLRLEELDYHELTLPLFVIKQIYNSLLAWQAGNTQEKEVELYCKLGFKSGLHGNSLLSLEGEWIDHKLPSLKMVWKLYNPQFRFATFFGRAQALLDALFPFAKLKSDDLHITVGLTDRKPSENPFYFTTRYGGHEIQSVVGLAEMPRQESLPGLDLDQIAETSRESGFEDSDLDEDPEVLEQEGDLKEHLSSEFKKMGILADKLGPISITTSAAPDKVVTFTGKGKGAKHE